MALSFSSIQQAPESIGIDPCFIHAVASVESASKGFSADGTIIVRFEKHVFLRELKKRKVPAETIESARQLTGLHLSTLNKAISLHHEAALCSASFGMFQIMGFNHKACGFDNVFDFVQAMQEGRQEVTSAIEKVNTKELQQERETSDRVLVDRCLKAEEILNALGGL